MPIRRPRRPTQPKLNVNTIIPADRQEFIYLAELLTKKPLIADKDYSSTPGLTAETTDANDKWRLVTPAFSYTAGDEILLTLKHRLITLNDLDDLDAWCARVYARRLSNMHERARYKSAFPKRNKIVSIGYIEGIHFNQAEAGERARQLFIEYEGYWHYVGANKWFITSSPNVKTPDFFNNLPVQQEIFVTNWQHELADKATKDLQRTTRDYSELQGQLHKLEERIGRYRLITRAIATAGSQVILETLDKLRAVEGFTKIDFRRDGFIIDTDDLWETYDNKRWYLGQGRIFMLPSKGIKVQNLRVRHSNHFYPFPHVNSSFLSACLGTYHGTLSRCYLSLDYYTAALTAFEFIRTVNPYDHTSIDRLVRNFANKRLPDKDCKTSVACWLFTESKGRTYTTTDDDEDED